MIAAAEELADLGVTANVVDPGATDNGWMDDATRAAVQEGNLSPRLGSPDDAARLVRFLCSEDGGLGERPAPPQRRRHPFLRHRHFLYSAISRAERASESTWPRSTPKTYRNVLGQFPTGVTVVTAVDDGEPVGMAIGSFASLSLDPALVLFCADHGSGSWARINSAGKFCVNILAEDQKDLCGQFASPGDRYAGVDWTETALGSPLLPGVLAHIDCSMHEVLDGGDHAIARGPGRLAGRRP